MQKTAEIDVVEVVRLFAELLHDYKAGLEVVTRTGIMTDGDLENSAFLVARCEDFFDRLGVRPTVIDMGEVLKPC